MFFLELKNVFLKTKNCLKKPIKISTRLKIERPIKKKIKKGVED